MENFEFKKPDKSNNPDKSNDPKNINSSGVESEIVYSFIDKHKKEILENIDKYTKGDQDKLISIMLYLEGKEIKKYDKKFLDKLENKFIKK